MASIVLSGDTSGTVTLSAPAVAGSSTQTLVAVTDTLAPIVRGTAVTASGTSIDFTGIPSWVKRITVMFNGVSTSGTSPYLIKIGSGSILTSGYNGCAQNQQACIILASNTTGFPLMPTVLAAYSYYSTQVLSNFTGNTWSLSGQIIPTSGNINWSTGTNASLSGVLDMIRITTVNGTDTFDAGSINIMYE